jgi:regulator of nucleoside diphosphate kinase
MTMTTITPRALPERPLGTEGEMTMVAHKASPLTRELSPHIALTARDFEQLSMLARAAANSMPDLASILLDELDRAHVLPEGRAEQTVYMGCEVEFRDETTGRVQTVTLVYPGEADISQGKISVLTPIGTALIGVQAGDSITWETRTGELRKLTVLQVRESQLG